MKPLSPEDFKEGVRRILESGSEVTPELITQAELNRRNAQLMAEFSSDSRVAFTRPPNRRERRATASRKR